MAALPDFTPIFARYEALRKSVDALFANISAQHADCVKCARGCSDCCHALFDLSLVEAMYLNSKFSAAITDGLERSAILRLADEADRRIYKFKHRIFKEAQEGRDSKEIFAEVARMRQRCPLLGEDNACRLYDFRPITCRVYGVPANIGGAAHSCGLAAFKPGQAYPTIALDTINQRLADLSREISEALQASGSKLNELHEMLVPLSMALMTSYDAEYLGLAPAKASPGHGGPGTTTLAANLASKPAPGANAPEQNGSGLKK